MAQNRSEWRRVVSEELDTNERNLEDGIKKKISAMCCYTEVTSLVTAAVVCMATGVNEYYAL